MVQDPFREVMMGVKSLSNRYQGRQSRGRAGPSRGKGLGWASRVPLAVILALQSVSGWPAEHLVGIRPQIFNGVVTFDAPFVGLLLHRYGGTGPWLARCTVSLIAPTRALTAAHCLCDAGGGLCQPGRAYAPRVDEYRVLIQNAGILAVASVAIPSGFSFPDKDLAVLALAEPVRGVTPVTLARLATPIGSGGRIVGFGHTSGWGDTIGLKRVGSVVTAPCGADLKPGAFLCWESDGSGASGDTCTGDSGAPLLTTDGTGDEVLAGIASGGYGACDGEDLAFDTEVATHLETIAFLAGSDPGASGGETLTAASRLFGQLGPGESRQVLTIEVPSGAERLTIVGNGVEGTGNDYSLRLGYGAPPSTDAAACTSDRPGLYEACTASAPRAGTWYAVYGYQAGLGGDVQLSASVYTARCGLDLDLDGRLDALTDGLLALRHLAGRSGRELTDAVLAPGAKRSAAGDIAAYLESAGCVSALDVDGDGARLPETDGRIILRWLFGFRGAALVDGAIAPTATRTDPATIAAALDALHQ